MRKIGFKNFRKFRYFEPLTISPVTMLVGANNAGKSTFLKGVLLANKNICNLEIPQSYGVKGRAVFNGFEHPLFTFDLTEFDSGISTFGRSINWDVPNEDMEFYEEFYYTDILPDETIVGRHDLTRFSVRMVVQRPEKTKKGEINCKAPIKELEIEDKANLLRFRYDFVNKKMFFVILSTETGKETELYEYWEKNKKNNPNDDEEKDIFHQSYVTRRAQIIELSDSLSTLVTVEMPLVDKTNYRPEGWNVYSHTSIGKYIENMILFLMFATPEEQEIVGVQYDKTTMNESSAESIVNERKKDIRNTALSFEFSIESPEILNIPTHAVTHSTFYNVLDKNDFMARSIHKYMNVDHPAMKAKMRRFILKWMDKFNIGKDFKIEAVGDGVGYLLNVKNGTGLWHPLSELGTGANQLMALIINLARAYVSDFSVVIVEEPEQNLHPNYQSKLIDLFANVAYSKKRMYRSVSLIIETHSEYLIRKSQVLVAENKYKSQKELEKDNPYKVYFFPSSSLPYDMEFQTNGQFQNDFGSDFYNEAVNLAFDVWSFVKE